MSSHHFKCGKKGECRVGGLGVSGTLSFYYSVFNIFDELSIDSDGERFQIKESFDDFKLTCIYAMVLKGPHYDALFCEKWKASLKERFLKNDWERLDPSKPSLDSLSIVGEEGEEILVSLSQDGSGILWSVFIPNELVNSRKRMLREALVLRPEGIVEVVNDENGAITFNMSLESMKEVCDFALSRSLSLREMVRSFLNV